MILRSMLVLTAVFIIPILLIRSQPATPSELDLLLEPPGDCQAPCFMGIQPMQTTVEQAISLLRSNAVIERVVVYNSFGSQTLFYQWRTQIRGSDGFGFRLENGVVAHPLLPLHITLGDVQLALGEPDHILSIEAVDDSLRSIIIFEYPEQGVHLFVAFYPCRIDQQTYWHINQQLNRYGTYFVGLGPATYPQLPPGLLVELDHESWAKQMRDYCHPGAIQ